MYLVIFPTDSGEDLYLFFHADPRPHGCKLKVVEGADLQELPIQNDQFLPDADPGELRLGVLGQSRRAPNKFRVFASELEAPMYFDILPNTFEVWATWEAWRRSVG